MQWKQVNLSFIWYTFKYRVQLDKLDNMLLSVLLAQRQYFKNVWALTPRFPSTKNFLHRRPQFASNKVLVGSSNPYSDVGIVYGCILQFLELSETNNPTIKPNLCRVQVCRGVTVGEVWTSLLECVHTTVIHFQLKIFFFLCFSPLSPLKGCFFTPKLSFPKWSPAGIRLITLGCHCVQGKLKCCKTIM